VKDAARDDGKPSAGGVAYAARDGGRIAAGGIAPAAAYGGRVGGGMVAASTSDGGSPAAGGIGESAGNRRAIGKTGAGNGGWHGDPVADSSANRCSGQHGVGPDLYRISVVPVVVIGSSQYRSSDGGSRDAAVEAANHVDAVESV